MGRKNRGRGRGGGGGGGNNNQTAATSNSSAAVADENTPPVAQQQNPPQKQTGNSGDKQQQKPKQQANSNTQGSNSSQNKNNNQQGGGKNKKAPAAVLSDEELLAKHQQQTTVNNQQQSQKNKSKKNIPQQQQKQQPAASNKQNNNKSQQQQHQTPKQQQSPKQQQQQPQQQAKGAAKNTRNQQQAQASGGAGGAAPAAKHVDPLANVAAAADAGGGHHDGATATESKSKKRRMRQLRNKQKNQQQGQQQQNQQQRNNKQQQQPSSAGNNNNNKKQQQHQRLDAAKLKTHAAAGAVTDEDLGQNPELAEMIASGAVPIQLPSMEEALAAEARYMEEEEEEDDNAEGGEEDEETGSDFSDTANERAREYRKGGYHPVQLGEVYNNRYRVVHKLGWGYFSTVWLVWDYQDEAFRAMKIQKSDKNYRDAAYDEIKLLNEIMENDPHNRMCCTRLCESFEHRGPHGLHVIMVFEVLGENLLKLIERYENRGIPIPIVKSICRQTLIGLHHVHSIDIIHTDIKPENVLLAHPKHKIHKIMKNFTPQPLSKRIPLADRDPRSMTKSQRKRYYKRMKQQRRHQQQQQQQQQQQDDDDDDDDDQQVASTSSTKANKDSKKTNKDTPTKRHHHHDDDDDDDDDDDRDAPLVGGDDDDQQDDDATTEEGHKKKDKKQFIIDEPAPEEGDSDTDPEWDVNRFHHVRVADFGNSCWTYRQFTDEVQTRQYRAPEVIIGCGYDTPIDIWSAACMFFELLTGEFLFDPKGSDQYSREEDHLALISEMCGPVPEHMACGTARYRDEFFDEDGNFLHITQLTPVSLAHLLHRRFRFSQKKSMEVADFLMPMLAIDPAERATALEMLEQFEDFFTVVEDDFAPLCNAPEEQEEEDEDYADAEDEEDEEGDDEEGDGDEDEEEEYEEFREFKSGDIAEWLSSKKALRPDRLETLGITLQDIAHVLSGGSHDEDSGKHDAVAEILELLQEEEAEAEEQRRAQQRQMNNSHSRNKQHAAKQQAANGKHQRRAAAAAAGGGAENDDAEAAATPLPNEEEETAATQHSSKRRSRRNKQTQQADERGAGEEELDYSADDDSGDAENSYSEQDEL